MPTRLYLLTALLLNILVPSSTSGQVHEAGTEIRFRTGPHLSASAEAWQDARLERVNGDTVWVHQGEQVLGLSLVSFEVQARTGKTAAGRGLGVGLLAGATAGGVFGAVVHEPTYGYDDPSVAFRCAFGGSCPRKPQQNSRLGDVLSGALRGALIGGALGWLIGRTTPEWVAIELVPEANSYRVSAQLYSRD